MKCWRNFLGLNPKGSYLSLEKEKENFVLCSSTPWSGRVSCHSRATMAKKCTKKRDARAKLLFCSSKPIALSPFSLPSPSSLLPIVANVAIQKFCYHGNVMSHFSSLYALKSSYPVTEKFDKYSTEYLPYFFLIGKKASSKCSISALIFLWVILVSF